MMYTVSYTFPSTPTLVEMRDFSNFLPRVKVWALIIIFTSSANYGGPGEGDQTHNVSTY